jgi:hypothetical protein
MEGVQSRDGWMKGTRFSGDKKGSCHPRDCEATMFVRIVSIEDVAAPGERSGSVGRYRVVLEAEGVPNEFQYRVNLLTTGGHSVSWEPAKSFLSDFERVPVMVVAAITETVIRFHLNELVSLPTVIEPLPLGPDSVIIKL